MKRFDAHLHLGAANDAWGIVCTSQQDEWGKLDSVAFPSIPSVGLLPDGTDQRGLLPAMEEFLAKHTGCQIGEVGLDGRFPHMELQTAFFTDVLHLAQIHHRLVSIHAVHADGLLLSLLNGSVRSIWHGFTGSVESARLAAAKRCVVSLGPRTVKSGLWKRLEELNVPFLLETDSKDGGETALLEWMYHTCAQRLGLTSLQLQERIDEGRTICTNDQIDRQ
ncbi:MAG: TatD family hydrolase [Sphaerochaetaceae bacterium]